MSNNQWEENCLKALTEAIEKDKIPCPNCEGVGKRDYEIWTGIWGFRRCNSCHGTGKVAGELTRELQKALR